MIARTFAAVVLSALPLAAQSTPLPPPVPSVSVAYRYWPEQFVEWTTGDFPYTMVELDADTQHGKPLLDLVLTDKEGKRHHYVNDPQLVTESKAYADEVALAKLQFDRPETTGKDATYTLRAVLPDNTPVQWRFVQGSELMEVAGGITPLPQIPVPVFAYREQGAIAGDGSAIAIGKQVSAAEPWTEISKPPYFVAYRGAYSVNAHTIVFTAGKASWKIDSAPDALKAGATWKLSDGNGRTITLTAVKVDGDKATIREVDSALPRIRKTFVATSSEKGWQLESIRFVPNDDEKHSVTLSVEGSELNLAIGKKNKIATATIDQSPATSIITIKSPDWAKGKGTRSLVKTENGDLTIAVMPVK